MTFELLITLIMAAAPSIIAILGIITATVKCVRSGRMSNKEVIDKFEETREAVMNTKEYESLKLELQQAHAENRALKKQISQLLTAIDKVVRTEE